MLEAAAPKPAAAVPNFLIAECGLSSQQLWAALLTEAASGRSTAHRELVNWLRNAALVGRSDTGELVLLAATAAARQRLGDESDGPAAGFPETAFSKIEIWPLMSDSDWAPSSGTVTLSSLPALRAPENTICQKNEVVSLTMIGMVGFSSAGADGTTPLMARAPSNATRRLVEGEVRIFMAYFSAEYAAIEVCGRTGGSFRSRVDS
jgi:hypothetical protein